VTSSDLTPAQANQLRQQVARHLQYLNKLCERCNCLGWPIDDPIVVAAQEARKRM
jgi:hypothetical protein